MVWLPLVLNQWRKEGFRKEGFWKTFILSWNIFDIISMFSLIILVGILSFWMVFEESRVLIRDSILCFAIPLNEKLGLLGFCFITAMILGCCLNFSMNGPGYATLTNRSSLHCKPSDGTIFAKKLLNICATKLLLDTILVLSSISVILVLTLFLSEKNGLTICQKRLLSTIFLCLGYWKNDLFSLRKRDTQ